MRFCPVLFLLFSIGCAHAPAPKKVTRCSTVTSARDLARVRTDERRAFLDAKEAVEKLSQAFEVVKTVSLNDRNRGPKPLSVEQTVRVRDRLGGQQKILAGESQHLDLLAKQVAGLDAPAETLSDDIANDPMLSELQRVCAESEDKTQAELASTKSVIDSVLIEFRQIVSDNQLRVRLEER